MKYMLSLLISICCLLVQAQSNQAIHTVPSSTIKIVSWNVQMLPMGLSFIFKALRKDQHTRAPWIIEHCLEQDYQVIVFQEVFDTEIIRKFKSELEQAYPYQVGPHSKWGVLQSNGVLIVSKIPMKYLDHVIFSKGVHADRFAAKGCTLVELEYQNVKFQIVGTHLQAEKSIKAKEQRALQYQDIRGLLDRNSDEAQAVFVIGDLNTIKNDQPTYAKMLNIIEAVDYGLDDAHPYTYDSENSWVHDREPIQLDYILLNARRTSTCINNQGVLRPKMLVSGKGLIDYSDHYGIVAEVEIGY